MTHDHEVVTGDNIMSVFYVSLDKRIRIEITHILYMCTSSS